MGSHPKDRWNLVTLEFTRHLPYTTVGSLIAMAGVWWFGAQQLHAGQAETLFTQSRSLFHLFHPLHVCLSAIATTSLSWRYDRQVARAILIGALGTIVPCGLSDYVFPYLGGVVFGQTMEWHVCLTDHPQVFWPFLALGILGGFLAEKRLAGSHLFSHGAHVLISSTASLLYLISFGFTSWMVDARFVFPAFATIVLAVWVPCCISDIVVPVSTAHRFHAHSIH